MPTDTQLPYRAPHEAPDADPVGPREPLGSVDLPVIGAVEGELRLDRAIHLEVDRHAAALVAGGGLVLRAEDDELPTVALRAVHVDLVDGLVRGESTGLGPLFDRALTVLLCSVLRQLLGWTPGTSSASALARRLPHTRRKFPRTSVTVTPETRASVDVDGGALTVSLSRPALLRFLGIPLKVLGLRYDFASGRISAETSGVGPVRRGIMRVAAWALTRWLRPKLPPAMARPGYDLFADPARREHLLQLVERLRGGEKPNEHDGSEVGAGIAPHALARAGEGKKAGFLGVVSASKAALVAALATLRITADDVPEATRVLFKIPLGPLSRVGLATDREGEVVITKHAGGLRVAASRGLYLFADQFPELAELRLVRIDVDTRTADDFGISVQTEPPLGPLGRALLGRAVEGVVRPRVPKDRLRAGGLWDEGPDHVIWRQGFGEGKGVEMRTQAGADVELRLSDETVELVAPGGLEATFEGLPLPPTKLRRVVYRRADGALEVDGEPGLGAFGQAVAGSLLQVRAAPHAPSWLGVATMDAAEFDPEEARAFVVTLVDVTLPAVGKLELRMDPTDTLTAMLGPAVLTARSGRGLLLLAPELKLALHLRGLRYDLPTRALLVDSTPALGPYMTALVGLCIETFLLPLVRKGLTLWPDTQSEERWTLAEKLGARLTLAPGATLSLRRTADGLEVAASEPLMLDGGGGMIADVALGRVRWLSAEDRLEVESEPPAGPLLMRVLRSAIDRAVPDGVARAVAKRLALPEPPPAREPARAPTLPPIYEAELAHVGQFAVHVDASQGLTIELSQAQVRLTGEAVVRMERLGAQLVVRGASATFMPFTLALECDPPTGELEHHLLAQAARVLLAPLLRLCWPADRPLRDGRQVLLAIGPIELCVPPGGTVVATLDPEGVSLRCEAGLHAAGLDFLPDIGLHALRLRFADWTVEVDAGAVAQRFYVEEQGVGTQTTALFGHLLRVLLLPHLPVWTQKLGVRVLPPPPELVDEPAMVKVWKAQLPLGFARTEVAMDPYDVLEIRASRHELKFASVRGIVVDLPGLRLRVTLHAARYHMVSGELQLGDFGQVENAVAEGLLRKALAAVDPTLDKPDDQLTLADVLDRFPVEEDGKVVLFTDKLIAVKLDPKTEVVVRIDHEGLQVSADPPLILDGLGPMNFVFGGLRYDFKEAKFDLQLEKDGVIAGLFAGLLSREGEKVLDNAVRPLLPRAMRGPGWSLASDPHPHVTMAALLRTLSMGKLGKLAVTD